MKKSDAEQIVRRVVHDWASETGFDVNSGSMPRFYAFFDWLKENWPDIDRFRSIVSPRDEIERWFDDELRQNWRN